MPCLESIPFETLHLPPMRDDPLHLIGRTDASARQPDHASVPAATRHGGRGAGRRACDRLWAQVFEALDYGLMLVGVGARLRHANRIAARTCAAGLGLSIVDGRVQAAAAGQQGALLSAIDAASGGRRTMLTLRHGAGTQSVAVLPLGPETAADALAAGPLVLLVLGRPQVCQAISVEFFAREYRLTLAEISVLRRLCDGEQAAEIACGLGVALSTVRTHISNLRQKTATRNIGDLVRQVTLLPPIVARSVGMHL